MRAFVCINKKQRGEKARQGQGSGEDEDDDVTFSCHPSVPSEGSVCV